MKPYKQNVRRFYVMYINHHSWYVRMIDEFIWVQFAGFHILDLELYAYFFHILYSKHYTRRWTLHVHIHSLRRSSSLMNNLIFSRFRITFVRVHVVTCVHSTDICVS